MSDMKKVGLIFKEDGTADFVRSLKGVNAELRENHENMKLTQASWDKNTKASEKLNDRLVNLRKSYDLYDKKLVVLNEELEALKNNENATEDQIKSKEAQIKSTEATMKRYENRIEGVSAKLKSGTADIEEFGRKLQDTGNKIESVGKKFSIFTAAYAGAMTLAVKKASEWESAWVDVLKVTDGTEKQLNELSKGIRNMAQELPVSANEIAGVVEAASKLGVGIDYVEDFAETMVKMEIATGISASDSATAIARFAEITKMSFDDVDRLGSVIAELGDNYATTEREIIDMSMGLAAAGSQVGMHQSDIMALATALSSVGLEAQAGGSAMSKLMVNMELATKTGDGLVEFADVAGVSGAEFARIFESDATKAISMFIEGLDGINKDGGSAIKTLDDMGIKEVRLRDTLLRAANASDTFTGAIEDGSRAWEENIKLNSEAEIQADTLANQWQLTKNMMEEIAITLGEIVVPVLKDFLTWIQGLLKSFQELSPGMQKAIVVIGGIVAAVGPLLIIIGKLVGAVGTIIANWGVIVAIVTKIGAAIGFLMSPIGLLIAGVTAVAVVVFKNWDAIKEWTMNLVNTMSELFGSFIEWVTGIWDSFKETVVGAWDFIRDGVVNAWESMVEMITNLFNSVGEFFSGFWETTVETVTGFVDRLLEIFNLPIEFIKNAILLVIALFAMALENIYNEVIVPVVEFFKNAFDAIGELIGNGIEFFVTAFTEGVESVKEFFDTAFQWIMETVITPFYEFFKGIFDSVNDFIHDSIEKIKSGFDIGISWIKDTVITPLKTFFKDIFDNIVGSINTAIEKIKAGFQSVGDFVSTIFTGVRDFVANIFSVIGGVIKSPINGIVSIINTVLRSLNTIKVPDWVPGLGGVGINFPMIPFLAKGGVLHGAAIVGEAGAELLENNGNQTRVTPLTDGGGAKKREIIDYEQMARAFKLALLGTRFELDDDGFVRLVDNRLLEVLD